MMNEIETCREVLEQQLYVASCVDDSLSPRMKQLSAALSWLATVEAAQMPQPAPAAPTIPDGVREALAEYAHDAWSGWMKYMFEKGERRGQFKVGSEGEIEIVWIMPPWAVERWTRQMNTPYAHLPESEKESDRAEADRMLAIVRAWLDAQRGKVQAP